VRTAFNSLVQLNISHRYTYHKNTKCFVVYNDGDGNENDKQGVNGRITEKENLRRKEA
jgi:hypothetical protein